MNIAPILALALAAPVAATLADWREETAMAGVQYVGRVPADGGELLVQGWRNDGGTYVDDQYFALSVYSTADRIALSAEKFRYREPDGVAAWTIGKFMSYPGVREKFGVNFECGIGAGFTGRTTDTDYIIGIVDFAAIPGDNELYHDGVRAAARVDLKTGTIEPIAAGDVYCIQTLGD